MELRPAELEDLRVCGSIPMRVASSHAWQLLADPDSPASPAAGELHVTLRRHRLPRPVAVDPPGAPLEVVWDQAAMVFVAAEEDEILGFVALDTTRERPAARIARVVVAPAVRRQGIGTALVHTATRWATTEGLVALAAHCSARNDPAVAFYLRCGFSFAGYSESYYGRNEVALFWQRAV
jgi:GNAT superfamily N-acetyltransferase